MIRSQNPEISLTFLPISVALLSFFLLVDSAVFIVGKEKAEYPKTADNTFHVTLPKEHSKVLAVVEADGSIHKQHLLAIMSTNAGLHATLHPHVSQSQGTLGVTEALPSSTIERPTVRASYHRAEIKNVKLVANDAPYCPVRYLSTKPHLLDWAFKLRFLFHYQVLTAAYSLPVITDKAIHHSMLYRYQISDHDVVFIWFRNHEGHVKVLSHHIAEQIVPSDGELFKGLEFKDILDES